MLIKLWFYRVTLVVETLKLIRLCILASIGQSLRYIYRESLRDSKINRLIDDYGI